MEWTKKEGDPQGEQCRVQVYLSWRKRVKIRKKEKIMYIGRIVIGKKRINKLGGDQRTKGVGFTGAWEQL